MVCRFFYYNGSYYLYLCLLVILLGLEGCTTLHKVIMHKISMPINSDISISKKSSIILSHQQIIFSQKNKNLKQNSNISAISKNKLLFKSKCSRKKLAIKNFNKTQSSDIKKHKHLSFFIQDKQLYSLLESQVQRYNRIVGRVIDISVDNTGNPYEIIINLSGFLGIGNRNVAFPWKKLKIKQDQKFIFIPKDTISWMKFNSSHETNSSKFISLIDSIVEYYNGEKIGRIVDVLVNSEAKPQGVVINTNQSLNDKKHNVIVSWTALSFYHSKNTNIILLELNNKHLENLSTYNNLITNNMKLLTPTIFIV